VQNTWCVSFIWWRRKLMSAFKKTDRGAIISQVKNWTTSWVNNCQKEAEYLKSFSLFAVFMDPPDVKEWLGHCHSYVRDTYIAVTWMTKKENLLFYNRLTTRNFNQCTSCPAEHEHSSMKWGEMVVNHQQHMHQAVYTINKKSNSRFTVKEGHDTNNLDATLLNSRSPNCARAHTHRQVRALWEPLRSELPCRMHML
jgi:hypothetical protein